MKYKYNKPVKSVLIYLIKDENIKNEYYEDDEIKFNFNVVKIWNLDLEKILKDKILCLIPFVPIIKKDEKLIKESYTIIVEADIDKESKENLLSCMLVFSTLMYKKEIINKMIAPIEQFKKTEFFHELVHDLVEEGKAELIAEGEQIGIQKGKKELLLSLLNKKFPTLPENVIKAINDTGNILIIQNLVDAIFEINSPEQILAILKQ